MGKRWLGLMAGVIALLAFPASAFAADGEPRTLN